MTLVRAHLMTCLCLTICLALVAGNSAAQDSPAVPAAPAAVNPHGPLSVDCHHCHQEGSWEAPRAQQAFDHSTTGFPLEGRHRGVACRDCHQDPRFAFVGTACADCHDDWHRGQLGLDCQECHSPRAWVEPGRQRRDHDATGFPLVGAHSRVDCDACHQGPLAGDFVGTPTDCYFCHAENFAATTNPDHQASGFGTDCRECHSPYASTWGGGDFTHPASFPLVGGHAGLECAQCHTAGFGGAVPDCYACHQTDYEAVADPDHVDAGFPTQCVVCHSSTAWSPASFNHDVTGFALTGAHRSADCAACHTSGYTGTPSDCYACHQADFEGTTDPDHLTSGFGTDCAACHGTTAWEPSTWDHDPLFPITTGRHANEWVSCADCHVVAGNYSTFECIFCHEHNQTDMDRKHDEENGYQFLSTACLDCHPRGEEND